MGYQYRIEECDVVDKDRLSHFRKKRAEWVGWLRGDEPHSIWRQITSLLWDFVLYQTVIDLRNDALEHPTPRVGFNAAVARLFDVGFAVTQATAIRRLTDRQPRDPRRGIISVRRLVADIKSHRDLMTREVYVAFDGLPYDAEPLKRAWFDKALSTGMGTSALPTTGPDAWGISELVHKNFDRLTRTAAHPRSRDDLISFEWFDWLDSLLDTCNDVRKFTDKFIAHAAEAASRVSLTPAQTGVTMERLNECHHVVYRVAAFVYGPLLWEGSYGAVPVPQYDHLEHLDKGWISEGQGVKAREFWDRNLELIERWEDEPWPTDSADSGA